MSAPIPPNAEVERCEKTIESIVNALQYIKHPLQNRSAPPCVVVLTCEPEVPGLFVEWRGCGVSDPLVSAASSATPQWLWGGAPPHMC